MPSFGWVGAAAAAALADGSREQPSVGSSRMQRPQRAQRIPGFAIFASFALNRGAAVRGQRIDRLLVEGLILEYAASCTRFLRGFRTRRVFVMSRITATAATARSALGP